jgi:hypothetical protein
MNKKACLLFLIPLFTSLLALAQEKKQFSALLITKTAGWHHESINEGVTAIKTLAARNYFDVQWHQEGIPITDKYLENFQVLIFLNTTGDIFKEEEQKAIERFIQSGKGFAGIHSASDTEYDWPWYTKLVGRMFHIHPAIKNLQACRGLVTDSFGPMNGMSLAPKLLIILTIYWRWMKPLTTQKYNGAKKRDKAWVLFILLPGITSMMGAVLFTPHWDICRQTIPTLHF